MENYRLNEIIGLISACPNMILFPGFYSSIDIPGEVDQADDDDRPGDKDQPGHDGQAVVELQGQAVNSQTKVQHRNKKKL
jgi:hypothetical protein